MFESFSPAYSCFLPVDIPFTYEKGVAVIGTTISHYEILEKLGEGAMGVVYKAQDLKLERLVAIKFLPPHLSSSEEDKARFIREAKAASSLDHPNICTVHEIDTSSEGQLFIVMAYYEGQTLQKKIKNAVMPLNEVNQIALQIADGLAKAHENGIIHRDLKPANVLITKEGMAKVLDFGLAKSVDAAHLSRSGTTVGTLAYMAPEQIQGSEADSRSDVFSFGILLFEMLAGHTPFRTENAAAAVYSIISDAPESISVLRSDVPVGLERVIEKALSKSPKHRWQNMREVHDALRSLQAGVDSPTAWADMMRIRSPRMKRGFVYGGAVTLVIVVAFGLWYLAFPLHAKIGSLAVLPLRNLSADSSYEYFADGMTEELITDLAQIQRLRVISMTTMMRYKGAKKTLPEIGRELNVDAVVEGSVLRSGDKVRISLSLVRAATDEHLWENRYDRGIRDMLGLQGEVARSVARQIQIVLTPHDEAGIARVYTANPAAYEEYLKGRYYWNKEGTEQLKKATGYFQRAIELDSTFALAYAGLADCYVSNVYGGTPPRETLPQARAAAMKALAIDSSISEVHSALAGVRMHFEWDWSGAEREHKRALELNQNSAEAHHYYAFYLSTFGRFDEAVAELKRALEIDPLSPFISRTLGATLFRAGRFDQAIQQLSKALELEPNDSRTHYLLGSAYEQKQMNMEAFAEYLSGLSTEQPKTLNQFRKAFAVSGMKGYWEEYLDLMKREMRQRYVPAYHIAEIYARLGDKERALVWLSRAYDERSFALVYLTVDPWFDNIRSDPRFTALVNKMGLGSSEGVVRK